MEFTKLHGLGNDFVVIDRRVEGTPLPIHEAVALCDRHRGIGADGVLSVLPSERAPLAMHVTNSDGSHAEMCGNGLRCVVRWAVDRGVLPPEGGPVETGAGVLECRVEPDGHIRVDMGRPELTPARIPMQAEGDRVVEAPLDLDDPDVPTRQLSITAVSMGNPHAVWFVPEEQSPRELAERLGSAVEHHPRFPRRTNAEFARLVGQDEIELVVWERGSGLTQACGTGACATAVAAVLTNRARADVPVTVHLPGGPLRIEVAADLSRVWMTGPAVEVFRGTVTHEGRLSKR